MARDPTQKFRTPSLVGDARFHLKIWFFWGGTEIKKRKEKKGDSKRFVTTQLWHVPFLTIGHLHAYDTATGGTTVLMISRIVK